MAKILKLKGRLSFEHIFTPDASNGSKPAYSASLLIGKDDPQIQVIKDDMLRVAKEKWKDRGPQILRGLVAEGKVCLRDGDLKTYSGYAGMMYLTSRSAIRPTVVDNHCVPLTGDDGLIYSGCYVVVHVELWAQDNANGKRINAKLLGVQYWKKGDSFAAGSAPSQVADFSDLGDEDEVEVDLEPGAESEAPWL